MGLWGNDCNFRADSIDPAPVICLICLTLYELCTSTMLCFGFVVSYKLWLPISFQVAVMAPGNELILPINDIYVRIEFDGIYCSYGREV